MVGFRQFVRPEITASAIAHLSIVALVFLYTEAHPFSTVPPEAVNVDIVTTDEIEKRPQPAPSPSPQLPTDLSALTKAAEQPTSPAALQPAPPSAAPQSASPAQRQAAPNGKEAALQQPPQPPPSAEPHAQPIPPNPAPAASPSPGYAQPGPDVTVKYHVVLGLPEAMPASVLSADAGDKAGDGGDAATRADVSADMVTALRRRIRECSKLPPSVSPSDHFTIKMRLLMRRDGRLAAEPMAKEGPATLKAIDLKNSAVAALAACQPYMMLPPDKYEEWKVIDLTFTPGDFNS